MIRSLCIRPERSASEIAIALGVPLSIVAPLLRELMIDGLILEDRARGADAGRRLPRYRLDVGRLALLGAEVGVDRVRVVATSFSGGVLASMTQVYGKGRSAMTCIDSIASASLRVHQSLGTDGPRIVGMGLGIPSTPDAVPGDPVGASSLRARDIPFCALLARELQDTPLQDVPLLVRTAPDVAALGEFEFSPVAGRPPSLLYLSLEEELHAGIIIDGDLLTDLRGSARDIGHTILQVDGPPCTCGRLGCAQALIGRRSLLATGDPDPIESLRRKLALGAPDTQSAVERAGACLGTLVHNLAILYRPSRIVLGGSMVVLGDALLRPARQALRDCAVARHAMHPTVTTARFGTDAIAVGAAALARRRLTGRLDDASRCAVGRPSAPRTQRNFLASSDLSLYQVQ